MADLDAARLVNFVRVASPMHRPLIVEQVLTKLHRTRLRLTRLLVFVVDRLNVRASRQSVFEVEVFGSRQVLIFQVGDVFAEESFEAAVVTSRRSGDTIHLNLNNNSV